MMWVLVTLGSSLGAAQTFDVEVRHYGTVWTYEMQDGDVVDDVWEAVVPPVDRPRRRRHWPDVRIRLDLSLTKHALWRLGCVVERTVRGDVQFESHPSIGFSLDDLPAELTMAREIPVPSQVGNRVGFRYLVRPDLEVTVTLHEDADDPSCSRGHRCST